ncbi:hypothetical protein WN51_00768 [Melipona quadrifasciata]|uniref:Uncharacterized protein n=1 Tax=Melipona quadrifasciata TaxID=166423 RepID=A0A0N0U4K6_9HYME|nr:hypothetical protein WN51_00768 [Melipona quadrifasciata]
MHFINEFVRYRVRRSTRFPGEDFSLRIEMADGVIVISLQRASKLIRGEVDRFECPSWRIYAISGDTTGADIHRNFHKLTDARRHASSAPTALRITFAASNTWIQTREDNFAGRREPFLQNDIERQSRDLMNGICSVVAKKNTPTWILVWEERQTEHPARTSIATNVQVQGLTGGTNNAGEADRPQHTSIIPRGHVGDSEMSKLKFCVITFSNNTFLAFLDMYHNNRSSHVFHLKKALVVLAFYKSLFARRSLAINLCAIDSAPFFEDSSKGNLARLKFGSDVGAIAQYQTTPLLLEVYATPPRETPDPNQPVANFRCISVAPEKARKFDLFNNAESFT